MKKLNFDTGIEEFEVNGAVLRFNPADPNVYARFAAAAEKITDIEKKLVVQDAENSGNQVLRLMEEADRKAKDILAEVFGSQNDFDKMFNGVNVVAVAANGERVLTNFFAAISPILTEGAQKCARDQAAAVAAEVRPNGPQSRAASRGK